MTARMTAIGMLLLTFSGCGVDGGDGPTLTDTGQPPAQDSAPEVEPETPLPVHDAAAAKPDAAPELKDAGPAAIDSSAQTRSDGGSPLVVDSGDVTPPVDASGAQCASAGLSCALATCCAGTTCVTDGIGMLCAAQCTGDEQCMSGCCAFVIGAATGACAPPSFCQALPPARTGCNLIGGDGQFLGVASSSPVASDGVCNQVSLYGSQVGTNSIFNQVGRYGSAVGSMSAYNVVASTPPAIICDGDVLRGFVTKNATKINRIDPDELCETLRANGL